MKIRNAYIKWPVGALLLAAWLLGGCGSDDSALHGGNENPVNELVPIEISGSVSADIESSDVPPNKDNQND